MCRGFVADVTHQNTLAFGVFYIPLVGTAVFHRNPVAAWWLAAVATTLVIIGFFAPGSDTEIAVGLTNRVSIVAIVITAYLIRHEGQSAHGWPRRRSGRSRRRAKHNSSPT